MTGKILVTGGAGYIGSVVVEQLLARGRPIVVLDDLSTGHRAAVDPGAEFVEGSIGDRRVLEGLFARHAIDGLMHLAAFALVAESVAHPQKYFANNVTAGRVLLEAAVAAGVRRVIFSSSCTVYGQRGDAPIDEAAPVKPANPYGETKVEFERLLAGYAESHGLASASLRYFNAAGASERYGEDHAPETHLIPNVLRVALGQGDAVEVYGTDYPTPDGTAVRDYVHVLDLADAHIRALDADLGGAVVLNLGTGTGYSVRAVTEAARRVTGRAIPTVGRARRAGDPPWLVAATGRAEGLLGWRPRHSSLEEILASACRWHQAHPSGYRQLTSSPGEGEG
ncbi:MAG TPA: UDP-glucose 4-epimerase GalE [Gemmatimonadales bacterium]|nr:UDP-glucose 4-epimerase GalE [Gemmatimonadales bacterium]